MKMNISMARPNATPNTTPATTASSRPATDNTPIHSADMHDITTSNLTAVALKTLAESEQLASATTSKNPEIIGLGFVCGGAEMSQDEFSRRVMNKNISMCFYLALLSDTQLNYKKRDILFLTITLANLNRFL